MKKATTGRTAKQYLIYDKLMESDNKKERVRILIRDRFRTFTIQQSAILCKSDAIDFPLILDDMFYYRWVK